MVIGQLRFDWFQLRLTHIIIIIIIVFINIITYVAFISDNVIM